MGTILRALTLLTLSCLAEAKQKDFYSFKVVNSRGRLVSLDKYRGSVSLKKSALMLQTISINKLLTISSGVVLHSFCVYVAASCSVSQLLQWISTHYKDLQQLQKDFGPFHFNVLAFPCNQFGQQEPGSDKEIDSFVRRVYGVSFPIFSKIAVASRKEPTWNFWKYLIDTDGKVVDAWGPEVSVKEIRPRIADMVRKLIIKRKEEL
ncbi:Glutathione peroxidase 7 [Labeo rohita]|uniref:Glutathione peroxidase 7 n=1 Tax=Labeo rohita TaxID=84645 RepID=A0ABQ8LGV6_LABRO|nr:Glutathione peroxidase 7 [Labeo rohita]